MTLSDIAIEQAPEAILWIDSSGRIHRANRAACQLLGYSQDELLGVNICELYRESKEFWHKRWSDLRKKGEFAFEDRLFTKSGQCILVEISGSLLGFEGEEYICIFVRDIAGRKRAEEEFKNALAEMEQLREQLQREVSYLRQEIRFTHDFGEIIGDNDKFKQILAEVEQVASTEATVLILG